MESYSWKFDVPTNVRLCAFDRVTWIAVDGQTQPVGSNLRWLRVGPCKTLELESEGHVEIVWAHANGEVLDLRPLEVALENRPDSVQEMVAKAVAQELASRGMAMEEPESLEEAIDLDEDDPDVLPLTGYEVVEVTPEYFEAVGHPEDAADIPEDHGKTARAEPQVSTGKEPQAGSAPEGEGPGAGPEAQPARAAG